MSATIVESESPTVAPAAEPIYNLEEPVEETCHEEYDESLKPCLKECPEPPMIYDVPKVDEAEEPILYNMALIETDIVLVLWTILNLNRNSDRKALKVSNIISSHARITY